MQFFAQILLWALNLYFYAFLIRFVLDLVRSINPQFRPRGVFLIGAEILLTITDPPLKFVRRFVPPIRLGSVAFDLSWTIVLLLLSVLTGLISQLG